MTSESDPPPPAACSQSETAAADDYIVRLYRELLLRAPGTAELEAWRGMLLGGMPRPDIRHAFLAGDEYRERLAAEAQATSLAASGLFDADWYLATYRDVSEAGLDPLYHYCRFGARENRQPNAWFDPLDYRARAGLAPDADALYDYLVRGEQRGLAPGPHFDPAWYRSIYRPCENVPALAHFLARRAGGGFAPCPRLWSVAQTAAADVTDPFAPFLASGQDLLQSAAPDITLLRDSGLFDENHYHLGNHDVFSAGMDLLTHYCAFGWQEGRNPNLYFDSRWYIATNPDVARLAVNPLVHYLLAGEAANRRPVVFFEPDWYRRTYTLPDGASPLAHYLAHRRTQQFSPNSLFDPAWYRTQCGGAARPGRDLFSHYLVAGMHDDVRPSAGFDAAAWRRQSRGRPSRHFPRGRSPEVDNPLINYLLTHYR